MSAGPRIADGRRRIAVVAALLSIYLLAVVVRTRYFAAAGGTEDLRFWMESAEHFRYIQQTALEGGIPEIDQRLEWPEGLRTRTDTILSMQIAGVVYRLFLGGRMAIESWAQAYGRLAFSLGVFPVYLLARRAGASRPAGLLASLAFAASLLATSRCAGHTVYREHLATPLFGAMLAAFLAYVEERNVAALLLAAIWGELALCSWILISFYAMVFVGLVAWLLFAPWPRVALDPAFRDRLAIGFAAITGAHVATQLVFDTYLRSSRFATSPVMLISYVVLSGYAVRRRYGTRLPLLLPAMAVVLVAVNALVPARAETEHVWDTLLAKLRYIQKPSDPSLLSFDARHLWDEPFASPSLFRFVTQFGVLFAAGLPALLGLSRRIARGAATLGQIALVFFAATSLLLFLVFFKVQPFLAVLWTPLLALSIPREATPRRTLVAALLAAAIGFDLVQTWSGGDGVLAASLHRLGAAEPGGYEQTTFTPHAFDDLLGWIGRSTEKDDAFYTTFYLGPSILVYADRPIVMNCFFQSDMPARLREQAEVLFDTEEALWRVCRKYRAAYFVYSPSMLLRSDNKASFRYIADRMVLSDSWACYQLNFHEDSLHGFELAHENAFFRVFRVRETFGPPGAPRGDPCLPLYDERRFRETIAGGGENARSQSFFQSHVRAYLALEAGQTALGSGNAAEASRALSVARQVGGDVPLAFLVSASMARATGRLDDALLWGERAVALCENVETLSELGETRLARGDRAGAEAELRRAQAKAPRDVEDLLRRAELAFRIDDFSASGRDLEDALELAPGDPRIAPLLTMVKERISSS
ncbi:MAG: hypothetical protein U0166_29175 [Acidobacteriota bacterium]